jgi:hypothetical protein
MGGDVAPAPTDWIDFEMNELAVATGPVDALSPRGQVASR